MSTLTAVIANHLNIAESMIVEIQEWTNVLWVRFTSGRPRFVSKKVKPQERKPVRIETFEVAGILIKRCYGEGRTDPSTYFFIVDRGLYEETIDIREIRGFGQYTMNGGTDWDKVSGDYRSLHWQHRDSYQSYEEFETAIWIPYVKQKLSVFLQKPHNVL